jgi:threonylcarbamoyladenosine tRNA methylthiotransferase MtaB
VLAEKDGTGYSPDFARVAVPGGVAAGTITTITPTSHDKGLLL